MCECYGADALYLLGAAAEKVLARERFQRDDFGHHRSDGPDGIVVAPTKPPNRQRFLCQTFFHVNGNQFFCLLLTDFDLF